MKQALLVLFAFCIVFANWVFIGDNPKDQSTLSTRLTSQLMTGPTLPKPMGRKPRGMLVRAFAKGTPGNVSLITPHHPLSLSTSPTSTVAPIPAPGQPTGPDPIRFRMWCSKDSVDLDEEVDITITAELLSILPSQLFFFDEQRSFSIKMLLPDGFQQTGGGFSAFDQLVSQQTDHLLFHNRTRVM